MTIPTIDHCPDGRCARDHYGAADWEALGHEGLAYGTPSPEILAAAEARGATVVAYDGDGVWAFYRPASAAPGSTTLSVVRARRPAIWQIAAVLLGFSLLVVAPWWAGPAVQRGVGITLAMGSIGLASLLFVLVFRRSPIQQVRRVCLWIIGLMALDLGTRLIWSGQWLQIAALVLAFGLAICTLRQRWDTCEAEEA
jgi:hypothetical protein